MKTLRYLFLSLAYLLASVLGLGTTGKAQKRIYIVGVPSVTDEENGKAIHEALLTLLEKLARPGDHVTVFDAYELKELLNVIIPEGNMRARQLKLKDENLTLQRFFQRSVSGREGKANEILLPLFLSQAASALRASAGDARLIVFGTPYFRDDRSPAFAFGPGEYPSDLHISASSLTSVFGTADRRELLKGVRVHWCLQGRRMGAIDSAYISRFWNLYVQHLGGVLSTFDPDWNVVLRRAVAGTPDPIRAGDTIDPTHTRIDIRKIHVAKPASSPTQDATTEADARRKAEAVRQTEEEARKDAETQAQREAEEQKRMNEADARSKALADETAETRKATEATARLRAAAQELTPRKGFIRLGAFWTSSSNKTDVDLYARSNGSEELTFQNTTALGGRYLRDIRTSQASKDNPHWTVAWEVIELHNTALSDITLWINLYHNEGGRVDGLVRVMFEDWFEDLSFSFTGGIGDMASGRDRRENNPNWIPINLSDVGRRRR